MADTTQVSRRLLDAIGAFRDAYKGDEKFKDVLTSLDGAEEDVEKLVPAVKDTTADEADSSESGKQEAEPKDMQQATNRARGYFRSKQ